MRRPGRREAVVGDEAWDVAGRSPEDPRTALLAHLIGDRSLLDDIEVVYEPEGPGAEPDLGATVDDALAAERAAEAELLIHGRHVGDEEPLTPETLEEILEPFPTATDATLHEVEPLIEALLDEGTAIDAADADDVEAEIAGGAWRDYVD